MPLMFWRLNSAAPLSSFSLKTRKLTQSNKSHYWFIIMLIMPRTMIILMIIIAQLTFHWRETRLQLIRFALTLSWIIMMMTVDSQKWLLWWEWSMHKIIIDQKSTILHWPMWRIMMMTTEYPDNCSSWLRRWSIWMFHMMMMINDYLTLQWPLWMMMMMININVLCNGE